MSPARPCRSSGRSFILRTSSSWVLESFTIYGTRHLGCPPWSDVDCLGPRLVLDHALEKPVRTSVQFAVESPVLSPVFSLKLVSSSKTKEKPG